MWGTSKYRIHSRNELCNIINMFQFMTTVVYIINRLCGLVVRVPGYRSRGPGFDSRRYQIFWQVVGLERGPFNLVSITEELLGRNSSGSGLKKREYDPGDPLRWQCDILYLQKLALTSPTSGGRSVSIVRLRTKATEFSLVSVAYIIIKMFWDRSRHSHNLAGRLGCA
jgi:hypothetical protein